MSTTQYHCGDLRRRAAVLAQSALNGIDYLEVATADQLKLNVYFLHKLPKTGAVGTVPPDETKQLQPENIRIEGGVRVTGIVVEQADTAGKMLKVTVSARGDFSLYTLRLVTSASDDTPPPGFDSQLSAIEFSFKVECPSDFDCKTEEICPPVRLTEPDIDYLAKDYASFRRLMLDRMSVLMPDWRERSPADLQVTLVELLAYAGDQLSYFQDAVATEAYLGTARRRVSLRRHARLLDYPISEGCNSRAWVALTVTTAADGTVLPGRDRDNGTPGSTLLTRVPDQPALITFAGATAADRQREHAALLQRLFAAAPEKPTVFETLHDVALFAAHNEIAFYTWSDTQCCLPRGATRATLDNKNGLALKPGDLLLFEEIASPVTGLAADADSAHRHVVRLATVKLGAGVTDPLTGALIAEVTWLPEDALPFPLCLSAQITDTNGDLRLITVGVARGNIVLADHGRTLLDQTLEPAAVPLEGAYRPTLPAAGLTFAAPFDPDVLVENDVTHTVTVTPANAAFAFTAAEALPELRLGDTDEAWVPRRDLLSSDRFAAEFVVEMERDGVAHLRFGDGTLGKQPTAGTVFSLAFRVGSGVAGNLGREALRHVLAPALLLPAGSVTAVRNPLPARGGTEPESSEQIRQFAPQAFRRQERAVTEADYAEVAQRYPGVQKATARFRWTGSWYTVFVTVDTIGGPTVGRSERFKRGLRAHLERFRLAGYDLEIADPIYVPLHLALLVCVKPGYFRSNVAAALHRAFSRQEFPDGTRGFFHPNNFTFGKALYLSHVYAAAMAAPGVASVQVQKFQRWGRPANNELDAAVITAAPLEILRLDADPNFPENGKIEFDLHGGL